MNTRLSILGMLAFVTGIVLFINANYVFQGHYGATGLQLGVLLFYEFIDGLLFFGGVMLAFIGFELEIHGGLWLLLAATVIILLLFLGAIFSLGVFSSSVL